MANKHFWKFVAGFLAIIILAMAALWGFEAWRTYKNQQELKTLIKEVNQRENYQAVKDRP